MEVSAGHGAKGRRLYDWIPVELARRLRQGWPRWLLVRRRRDGELAFYACFGPGATSYSGWCGWPGPVRRMRRRLQAGKGLCGLDEHQVHRWRSWYRGVTLAMLASGFLVLAAATEHARHPPRLGLIPLTCNAIQHRFAVLVANIGHRLR